MSATDKDHSERKRGPGRQRLADGLLEWLLPRENLGDAVYGTITVGALIAVESGLHDTYLELVGSVVVTLLIYWLAHSYSDLLGYRLATRERLSLSALVEELLHDWAVVRGASAPLLVLLTCWVFGVAQSTALTVALWTAAGSLVALELLAGVRARAQPTELVLEGCVGVAMGVGVLALRVILH